ncbi:MAG: hypothetical protein ACYCZF_13170 [Anaerolineae bacterium]
MELYEQEKPENSIGFVLKRTLTIFALVFVLLVLAGCMVFNVPIEQSPESQPGQVITAHLRTQVTSSDPGRAYLGVSLPLGSVMSAHVHYTGTTAGTLVYSSTLASQAELVEHRPGYYWWVGASPSGSGFPSDFYYATITFTLGSDTGIYDLHYGLASDLALYKYPRRASAPLTVTSDYGAGWDPYSITVFGYPGDVKTVTVRLANLGSITDSFTLNSGGWAQVLSGTTPITLAPFLAPREGITLTVQVTIPGSASVGVHSMQLQATSVLSPNHRSTLWLEANVLPDDYILQVNGAFQGRLLNPLTLSDAGFQLRTGYDRNVAAVSPDHRWIILASDACCTIEFIDMLALPGVQSISVANDSVAYAAFTSDSQYALVTNANAGHVRVVRMSDLTVTAFYTVPVYPRYITPLPGSTLAFVAPISGGVAVLDWSGPGLTKVITEAEAANGQVLSPNGLWLYTIGDYADTIYVIDTTTQALSTTFVISGARFSAIAVSPDGRYLYAPSFPAGKFHMLDAATGAVLWAPTLFWPNRMMVLPAGMGNLVYLTSAETSDFMSAYSLVVLDTAIKQVVRRVPYPGGTLTPVIDPGYTLHHVYLPVSRK